MKDYFTGVKTIEDKLAKVLAEENLLHVTDKSRYPITLTVTQNQAPDAQMEIWNTADGSTSSQDSVLRFIFYLDGMEIQTLNRLVLPDTLMTKIKGLAKKIHAAYVHAYFAATVEQMQSFLRDVRREDLEADAASEDFDGFYDDDDDLDDTPDDVEDIDDTEDDE